MTPPLATDLTTDADDAQAAWEAAVHGMVTAAKRTPDHIAAALEADPELAAAHCLVGFGFLGLARREHRPAAEAALKKARASIRSRGATVVEQALVQALERWTRGDLGGAAEVFRAALLAHPSMLMMRLDHACRFMIGDATGMLDSAELVLDALGDDAPGYALGMAAFAHEETGALDRAASLAREALERSDDDAWAAHALGHVFEMQDDSRRGRRWLERCATDRTYAHCGTFGAHIRWHEALFCLAENDVDAAVALHERLPMPEADFRDVSNAASLLYLIEERGRDVQLHWHLLAERVRPLATDHGYAFADAHYALVLAKAGRDGEAREMLASLEAAVRSDETPAGDIQRRWGLPLVRGILAFVEGDAQSAYDALSVCETGVSPIGGSHAQRELFRRLWIRAGEQLGRRETERAAGAYLTLRPHSPWVRDVVERAHPR
ncbi:MAG: tetratricopeptide repeat protein [Sandaracinaceae bacterium]